MAYNKYSDHRQRYNLLLDEPTRDNMNMRQSIMLNYLTDVILPHNELFERNHDISWRSLKVKEPKSNSLALQYRKKGNSCFSASPPNYGMALEYYNRSLCYAEEAVTRSLAFANRSAVYHKWNMYDLALSNIQLAKDYYPNELMSKLDDRREDCLRNRSAYNVKLEREEKDCRLFRSEYQHEVEFQMTGEIVLEALHKIIKLFKPDFEMNERYFSTEITDREEIELLANIPTRVLTAEMLKNLRDASQIKYKIKPNNPEYKKLKSILDKKYLYLKELYVLKHFKEYEVKRILNTKFNYLEEIVENIVILLATLTRATTIKETNTPFISYKLEFGRNTEYGRYLYLNEDVHLGEVIMLEKPVTSVLAAPLKYRRCAHCYIENSMSLIPCRGCVSAMYCSEDCMREALKTFHKYECKIIDVLQGSDKICQLAIKAVWLALDTIPTTEGLLKYVSNDLQLNPTLNQYQNVSTMDILATFQGIHQRNNYSVEQMQKIGYYLRVIKFLILENSPFTYRFISPYDVSILEKVIGISLLKSDTNTYPMRNLDVDGKKNVVIKELAHGVYNMVSLFNHSCEANADITNFQKNIVVKMKRRGRKGDQVFINYCVDGEEISHYTFPLEDRRELLKEKYDFVCKCKACKQKYPMLDECPSETELVERSEQLISAEYSQLNLMDMQEFCFQNDDIYPCQELYVVNRSCLEKQYKQYYLAQDHFLRMNNYARISADEQQ